MTAKTQQSSKKRSETAIGTMARVNKGPVTRPPALEGNLKTVADAVAGWPGIIATVHWNLYRPSQVDGIDFYLGDEELGHVHLDGWAHIATSPSLGHDLVEQGLAQRFKYHRGWVRTLIHTGPDDAVALFRRNYERLQMAGGRPATVERRFTGVL